MIQHFAYLKDPTGRRVINVDSGFIYFHSLSNSSAFEPMLEQWCSVTSHIYSNCDSRVNTAFLEIKYYVVEPMRFPYFCGSFSVSMTVVRFRYALKRTERICSEVNIRVQIHNTRVFERSTSYHSETEHFTHCGTHGAFCAL